MISISRKNEHLTDIFTADSFLELGNINYDVLVRLLNYEMVDYEDVTYFPIQKHGIGSSAIKDDVLRKKLPFLFFANINRKNRNLQLFITYGLLTLKNKKNREIFAPVVLIPVEMYFENEKIFFQQIAKPIENQVLISHLGKTKNITLSIPDKLDKLSDLDDFCWYLQRVTECDLHLENYLTYASIVPDKIKIRKSKFQRFAETGDYLHDKLFAKNAEGIYYIAALNREQRYAVHSANRGGNIAIHGRHGTGKTTALINVAVNAIRQKKRVLYVSNMEETLERVYDFFADNSLNQFVSRLYQSFASLYQKDIAAPAAETADEGEDFSALYENYEFIDKYQKAINNRILDYRYIEVVNELLLMSLQDAKIIPIDDLSNIYKFEFLEIVKALEAIQASLENISGSFKDSIWKDIPIFNNIKYPNQIIALIYQVEQCFKILESEKIILENEHGFREISNYAYLKNVIQKFLNLDPEEIPESWLNPEKFEEAKDKYRDLKNDIYQLQEEEYLLNVRYSKLDSLDIDAEISALLGDYFNAEDTAAIDKILLRRDEVENKLNRAALQSDIYKKSLNKIKHLLNWQFTVDNNILDEITRLEEVLKELEFNRTIVNIIVKGRFPEIFNQALDISKNIESAQGEIAGLVRTFSKKDIAGLEATVDALENYRKDQPIKRSDYRLFSNLKERNYKEYVRITKLARRFRELRGGIKALQNQFLTLTGYEYSADALYHMNYLHLYFSNIQNPMIRSKLAKFLIRVADGNVHKNYRRTFALFSQAYASLNEYYEILREYGLASGVDEFSHRVDEINKANAYLLRLFISNDRLLVVHRNYKNEYVAAEEYFKIRNSLRFVAEKKKTLRGHKLYRQLFGMHYRENQTNINHLARLMQNYKLYTECFVTNDDTVKSLEAANNEKIKAHLIVCREETERLNEIFKLYFKIFRDGVSRYYYESFQTNLDYLNKLSESKEELITYLTITDNFAVLNKYRLSKLINYIINEPHGNNFVNDFKYAYFSMLKEMHLQKAPFLREYPEIPARLDTICREENRKIRHIHYETAQKIRKTSGTRFYVYGIKNLDYNGFIKRTEGIKHLFLATSLTVNLFVNVKLFDMIIIDDAHLLSAEEYKSALEGHQLVIAGEQQLQSAVTNNLIARIHPSRMIQFNYRFAPTPMNILSHLPGLRGQIYNNFYENFGIDIKHGDLAELVCQLLEEKEDGAVNVFISSYSTQRKLYEELAAYLAEREYGIDDIIRLLTKNINISCLSLAYMYDADYNILFLEDYYEIDQEYLVFDMIDNMILCRKQIIIYDYYDRLGQDNDSLFMRKLRSVIDNKFTFKKEFSSPLVQQIAAKLEKQKYIVYSSNDLTLFVRDKNKLFGVLLFWDIEKSNFDIINDYRDFYVLNNKNNFKTIIVWAMEPSVDDIVKKIVEEIGDGETRD